MWRLITVVPSAGTRSLVSLERGTSRHSAVAFRLKWPFFRQTRSDPTGRPWVWGAVRHQRRARIGVRPRTRARTRACAQSTNGYNPCIAGPSQAKPEPVRDVHVPFVDLRPVSSAVKERVLSRVSRTLDKGDFLNGDAVGEFERRFAEYVGLNHCVGVASGLDALRLSLLASGLAPGDGVIVPAATFAATFEAVLQAGGTPVIVDVGEVDYNLDVRQAESAAAAGASHLMPVHLYGQLADMRALSSIAQQHGVQIVEDACQAHGASRDGVSAGRTSHAAAFSFYPSKNLGAMGDAGALVTDDERLESVARALRVHGETRKYHHEHIGYTARLDTIQAIVLLEKLPFLDEWNRQRQAAARFYTQSLSGLESVRLPSEPEGSTSVWHLYVVRVSDPDRLAAFLAARGIHTGRHYPEPVHLSPAYRHLGFAPGDFPMAEALAREGLSLPLYPGISETQLGAVCQAVVDYFASA
jgi:dTDP-4-amino-4,6-dideoxygalactose transaminase